jgi:hypothetical protein
MQRGLIVGFLFSLLIVISLGLFFTLSNKNFYLGQISSSLKSFENLNSEIQNLKREISNLRGEIENEKKEREEIKEEVLSFSQNFQTQVKNVKEKIEKPKEIAICQKRENDFPRHRVIFNEICWMGDGESPANEWIEIKNVSKEKIDLSGWQILNKNQKLKFVFEEGAKILPSEILLLKRGDDFSGAIKNSDEALFLFDKNCNLEDEVFATSSWPAGDNFSKRTAERKNDLSWQTSLDPGGTPGKENSPGFVEIEKEEEEKEPKISLDFPKEIFVNQEFKVSLSVSDLENETYDVKISILKISDESEQKRTISEISLNGEEWQSSYKYLPKVFSGASFSGDFKLRISQKYQDFKGEAEILVKVRQSSSKKVVEFKDRINIKPTEIVQIEKKEETPKIVQETQSVTSTSLNILISEVKIAEKTGDKNVFIELYNPNSTAIDLTGFYILRNGNSFVTQTMLSGKEICGKCYFLLSRKGSIWENIADVTFDDTLNEDDKITLKLKKSTKEYETIDEISWTTIPAGFSLGRKWDGEHYGVFEFQTPTPKAQNGIIE